jgi:hypothetical protein
MPIQNEEFDQLKIDKLKHFLETMEAKGQPKPFEIFVDALKVVPKTEDPKEFENYEFYMNEDTQKIRILIYNSNLSPRNDQYNFLVQRQQNKSMNGLGEIENIIQEKLAARDKEYELTKLKEDLEETKQKLEEVEEYAEDLETEIENLKANKYNIKGFNIGEIASVALENFVTRNPQIMAQIPMGTTLAGVVEQNKTDRANPTQAVTEPDAEVSFTKKEAANEPAFTDQQKRHIAFLTEVENVFSAAQFEDIMAVIGKFSQEPTSLAAVKQFLSI